MLRWLRWGKTSASQRKVGQTHSKQSAIALDPHSVQSAEGQPVPPDLAAYFEQIADGAYAGLEQVELNLLGPIASVKMTQQLSAHPIVKALGGIVLDDPNTSDHHLYLTRGPLAGKVFFLAHDDASRVVFSTLTDLLAAADLARREVQSLTNGHPECSPLAQDQAALAGLIDGLLDADGDDDIVVALSLIPSLDFSNRTLLERLALHDDFYIVEALGDELAKRPSPGLYEFAGMCGQHRHPQARAAGLRASKAIEALNARLA